MCWIWCLWSCIWWCWFCCSWGDSALLLPLLLSVFSFLGSKGGPKIERKENIVIKFDTTVSRAPRESSLIARRLLVQLNLLKTTRTIDKVTTSSLTARIKNKRKSNNPRAGIYQVVAVVSKPFWALSNVVWRFDTKPPVGALQGPSTVPSTFAIFTKIYSAGIPEYRIIRNELTILREEGSKTFEG